MKGFGEIKPPPVEWGGGGSAKIKDVWRFRKKPTYVSGEPDIELCRVVPYIVAITPEFLDLTIPRKIIAGDIERLIKEKYRLLSELKS